MMNDNKFLELVIMFLLFLYFESVVRKKYLIKIILYIYNVYLF